MEEAGIKNANQDFIHSKIVPMQNVKAVSHHTVAQVACGVSLITKVVLIKVDF